MAFDYIPNVLLAILTLIIGLWLIKRVQKIAVFAMKRQKIDTSLQSFLGDLIGILLKIVLFISAASMVGIQTTSFIAILGAAGLAVGLALQGSLSNFAGGVMILLFRPFKVGDLIETEGYFGKVQAINIFVTSLITPENQLVFVPNGAVSGNSIVNYTAEGNIRVDLVVGISYNADIRQAKQIIIHLMKEDPDVLETPAPSVNVLELGESSVNLAIRPFTTAEKYWDVYFGITEKVKIALDEAGIEIPFPQEVVHEGVTA